MLHTSAQPALSFNLDQLCTSIATLWDWQPTAKHTRPFSFSRSCGRFVTVSPLSSQEIPAVGIEIQHITSIP